MASAQRGNVFKLKDKTWAYRYRNLPGRKPIRPQVGGFATKADASAALWAALDRLGKVRRGEIHDIEPITVRELVARYLEAHSANVRPATTEKLRWLLSKAVAAWGDRRPDDIRSSEVEAWRGQILAGHRFEATQAFRQLLAWGVEHGFAQRNVAKKVKNPSPRTRKVEPFRSWEDIEAVAEEIGPHYGPAVLFAAETGMRPAEWIGLEWGNIDEHARVAYVEQAVVNGERTKTKTAGSVRSVPLTNRALAALDAVRPAHSDSRDLVFTTTRGKPIDLHVFRHRHWNVAVEVAGLAVCRCHHLSGYHDPNGCGVSGCACASFHRTTGSPTPYALRHTFATNALRAGLSTFEVARYMGTSMKMIDAHYGHFASDSRTHALALLNGAVDESARRLRAAA
jgi:integrase